MTPAKIIASTIADPSSKIGAGMRTPRLLRKIESPIDRLPRTRGSASKINHQKMICRSTGTLRMHST